jgi:hypothetical protein
MSFYFQAFTAEYALWNFDWLSGQDAQDIRLIYIVDKRKAGWDGG